MSVKDTGPERGAPDVEVDGVEVKGPVSEN